MTIVLVGMPFRFGRGPEPVAGMDSDVAFMPETRNPNLREDEWRRPRTDHYSSRIRILLADAFRMEIASTAICFWVSIAFWRVEASSISVSTRAPTLLSTASDRSAV